MPDVHFQAVKLFGKVIPEQLVGRAWAGVATRATDPRVTPIVIATLTATFFAAVPSLPLPVLFDVIVVPFRIRPTR
ncbi:hypothetical protein GCM10027290_00240 [Micromonospora sonneratiae]